LQLFLGRNRRQLRTDRRPKSLLMCSTGHVDSIATKSAQTSSSIGKTTNLRDAREKAEAFDLDKEEGNDFPFQRRVWRIWAP
jgi:hypothetical protein